VTCNLRYGFLIRMANTLRIGILKCDTWSQYPNVFQRFGDVEDVYQRFLLLSDEKIETVVFDCTKDEFPEERQFKNFDGFIISGSRYSAYDNIPWIRKLMSKIVLLDKIRKKLFGVCFGHQIISQALGGKVVHKGWNLSHQVLKLERSFTRDCPIRFPREDLQFLAIHQDQVVTIPPDSKVWISNDSCKVQGIIKDDHVLTMQAHPEIPSDLMRELLRVKKDAINELIYDRALKNLDGAIDDEFFSKLLVDFFRGRMSSDVDTYSLKDDLSNDM